MSAPPNVLRTTTKKIGVSAMALDMGKGIASVLVARQIDPGATGPAVAGIAAVLGHIYPVWLGFRGGKGVATTCGVFSILAPQATAIAMVVFLALVWWTRYISLGSVAGSMMLAPLAYLTGAAEVTVIARSHCCRHRDSSASIESPAGVCGHRAEARAKRMKNVAVLGTGSWGTALAFHLANAGHDVRLWGRNPELISEMTLRRTNAVYLPDIVLPPGVAPTASLEEALHRSDIVVAALPSHGTRAVIRSAAPFVPRQALIVSATKGLEQDTLLRASEVIAQEVRGARPVAVLSGPSFAIEVARGLPTACASRASIPCLPRMCSANFARRTSGCMRAPMSTGVEIGGALKNIIAIAAGVVEGLGLGQNALAALITRGLAEITRLACAVGGRRETLAGLERPRRSRADVHRHR